MYFNPVQAKPSNRSELESVKEDIEDYSKKWEQEKMRLQSILNSDTDLVNSEVESKQDKSRRSLGSRSKITHLAILSFLYFQPYQLFSCRSGLSSSKRRR